MLTIAHISDLHFCTPEIQEALSQFSRAINENIRNGLGKTTSPHAKASAAAVHNHFASKEVVEALSKALFHEDPDVIVISGDVTAFGDEGSFQEFIDWCSPLKHRKSDKKPRKIFIVPGNHDALQHHFSFLASWMNSLPFWKKWALSSIAKPLRLLDDHLDAEHKERRHLSNFNNMLGANDWLNAKSELVLSDAVTHGIDGVRVRFLPFQTTCNDPFWMNLGKTRTQDWSNLNRELDEHAKDSGHVNIVIAHHNPIASPSGKEEPFSFAYNGMPQGSLFLKELQAKGVDLVLHGHQHEHSLMKFDFDLKYAGHAFCLGADSSSSGEGGGFNLLKVRDPNHIMVDRHTYTRESGFKSAKDECLLPLERHRPNDEATLTARYELKRYHSVGTGDEQEDESPFLELQKSSKGIVYMSGRHFKGVRLSKFAHLKALMKHETARVRLLVLDPDLVKRLLSISDSGASTELSQPGVPDGFWGDREALNDLHTESEKSLKNILSFVETLSKDQKKRIDVRTSHTLLPFGAYVQDPDKPWGKMAVKILPIGAMGDLHNPVLRLHRRADKALYDHYLVHLKYLLSKAKSIAGEWADVSDIAYEM